MPTTKKSTSRSTSSKSKAKTTSRSNGKVIADVMTTDPVTIIESETVAKAAQLMRENDIGDVIVLDDTSARVKGIVTDRDLVVRAVAEGMDPTETTLASCCTDRLVCASPNDPLDKAARLMRDKAIRRLPVVDGEQAVGIVSIGDLAIELDSRSALAEISAAPPNS